MTALVGTTLRQIKISLMREPRSSIHPSSQEAFLVCSVWLHLAALYYGQHLRSSKRRAAPAVRLSCCTVHSFLYADAAARDRRPLRSGCSRRVAVPATCSRVQARHVGLLALRNGADWLMHPSFRLQRRGRADVTWLDAASPRTDCPPVELAAPASVCAKKQPAVVHLVKCQIIYRRHP